MNIKTRFAPSPTGFLHIGNIRTALFSWLYAKKYNGEFIIRIDDTDKERNLKTYTNNITYILNWLNIKSDKKLIFQSKRLRTYKLIMEKLIQEKKAYKCFCSKDRLTKLKNEQIINTGKIKYDGFCKRNQLQKGDFVIRINTENYKEIVFDDCVKGKITVTNSEIDDFIIAKNDFYPTYNFASVIDDIEFSITDIIRGEDHISNTPKQIIIFKLLNEKIPTFSHLPMILDENKKTLSKRDKDSNINYYKKCGFLPEAILNYIVRLGWSNKDKEIFTIKEMIDLFDIKNINTAPSIMNKSKLIWLNKHYIKTLETKKIIREIINIEKNFNLNYMIGPNLTELINFAKFKVNTLEDIITNYTFFYKENIKIEDELLKLFFSDKIIKIIENLYTNLKTFNLKWNIENIKIFISNIINENKTTFIELAPTIRIIITGKNISLSTYELIFLTGKILLLKKIRNIIKQYENGAIAQIG
ncbi:glutamate--tRNA ligase [Candidatus Azoamicus ciliaticola]|uniref:Glutamate--tRNA ligase n=1 Tax=Candidatus Azoamicus ciliaticola TaxID=2652803 RepID=A0A6J5JXX5_9GAMM|nr:glutamate--tRNA ligase [Candidatus Azoamicus ciliaticola]CAB3976372.1 Glutamate--tRNA ligase [Candidatus Azoamicus ciliaticola]